MPPNDRASRATGQVAAFFQKDFGKQHPRARARARLPRGNKKAVPLGLERAELYEQHERGCPRGQHRRDSPATSLHPGYAPELFARETCGGNKEERVAG